MKEYINPSRQSPGYSQVLGLDSCTVKVKSVDRKSTYVMTLRRVIYHSPDDVPPMRSRYDIAETTQAAANMGKKASFFPVFLPI